MSAPLKNENRKQLMLVQPLQLWKSQWGEIPWMKQGNRSRMLRLESRTETEIKCWVMPVSGCLENILWEPLWYKYRNVVNMSVRLGRLLMPMSGDLHPWQSGLLKNKNSTYWVVQHRDKECFRVQNMGGGENPYYWVQNRKFLLQNWCCCEPSNPLLEQWWLINTPSK